MAKKVFIGVGHGGSDPGATANNLKEKDLNLNIAKACAEELKKYGVKVLLSRAKDENDPIENEISECNKFSPDLALDIHNNAGGGDGAEVYYYSGGGKSQTLAKNVLSQIKKVGQNSRGIKTKLNKNGTDYFGFIREVVAPSVIIECAFVDNKTDIKIINTKEKQTEMGKAIALGVLKTLGVSTKIKRKYFVTLGPFTKKSDATKLVTSLKKQGVDAILKTE